MTAGKTGARGWRDAGDCSSEGDCSSDKAGGDDGGGVGDGDGRARKRRRVGTGTEGRHGGLSAAGALSLVC